MFGWLKKINMDNFKLFGGALIDYALNRGIYVKWGAKRNPEGLVEHKVSAGIDGFGDRLVNGAQNLASRVVGNVLSPHQPPQANAYSASPGASPNAAYDVRNNNFI